MKHEASPNHDYVLARAGEIAAGAPPPRVLDFGCGTGSLIRMGRARGLDIVGADAYPRHWTGSDDPVVAPYVFRIEGGRLPFADGYFDVVTSNMVFEHISPGEVPAAFREIARVLKSGGRAFILFPTHDVWFEGHVGIYFPHRLKRWPRLRRAYLKAAHRLGLGYLREHRTETQWVEFHENNLDADIFHHRFSTVRSELTAAFGREPDSLAADYMRYRITDAGRRTGTLARLAHVPLMGPLLSWICHKRASRVIRMTRS
jgi:SAM-dependent methyltransferase